MNSKATKLTVGYSKFHADSDFDYATRNLSVVYTNTVVQYLVVPTVPGT